MNECSREVTVSCNSITAESDRLFPFGTKTDYFGANRIFDLFLDPSSFDVSAFDSLKHDSDSISLNERSLNQDGLFDSGSPSTHEEGSVEKKALLVRFSPGNTTDIIKHTGNTIDKALENKDKVDFVDVYKSLGIGERDYTQISECRTDAYTVRCTREEKNYVHPISCSHRYLCSKCRERLQRKERAEISDVFTYLWKGILTKRSLNYGVRHRFIQDVFTVPESLTMAMLYDFSLINRIFKVIRNTLTKFYGGVLGGVSSFHEWRTEYIWKPSFHFTFIYSNVVRFKNKNGRYTFGYVNHFLSKDELENFRNIYFDTLNKEFADYINVICDKCPDTIVMDIDYEKHRYVCPKCASEKNIDFDHKFAVHLGQFHHKINYMVRTVFDDFEKGFIGLKYNDLPSESLTKDKSVDFVVWKNEYDRDKGYMFLVPSDVIKRILWFRALEKKKRIRWFGYLSDSVKTKWLKYLNVFREKIEQNLVCRKCETTLYAVREYDIEYYDVWFVVDGEMKNEQKIRRKKKPVGFDSTFLYETENGVKSVRLKRMSQEVFLGCVAEGLKKESTMNIETLLCPLCHGLLVDKRNVCSTCGGLLEYYKRERVTEWREEDVLELPYIVKWLYWVGVKDG